MNQPTEPQNTDAAQPQDPNAINIELSEEIAEGEYANLAMIAHSSSEFVVDFIRLMPGLPKAKVKSRIILTPEHAKRLQAALAENIERFEQAHGAIKPQQDAPAYPMGFGGTMGEA
ncbi:hypothetical protein CDA63_00415 [Hymenobacter amundsenii]|uniref:Transcriptional accessory protein n=1 Tax=Hymenobacter amundsenii TaxID=2006685 RepID=A0A246FQ56_9BACT|nr:DUF3467 domain-containing protein [Hymenobacter amundsenii]OWP64862.1 hypothetical protein CDA63_00415 [Hymenobacter amundsenii]